MPPSVKIPERPPSEAQLWGMMAENPGRIADIMQTVTSPTHEGRYVHWDKLRFLTPPAQMSHEEWWFGLKMRRAGTQKAIPLKDQNGKSFRYSLVDPLPENLHLIDLYAGGAVQIPEPVLNQE